MFYSLLVLATKKAPTLHITCPLVKRIQRWSTDRPSQRTSIAERNAMSSRHNDKRQKYVPRIYYNNSQQPYSKIALMYWGDIGDCKTLWWAGNTDNAASSWNCWHILHIGTATKASSILILTRYHRFMSVVSPVFRWKAELPSSSTHTVWMLCKMVMFNSLFLMDNFAFVKVICFANVDKT